MPRDGSGNASLVSGNPVVSGTTVSSTVHNNTLADIASMLTGSVAKNGETTATANLPMGTYAHTNVGDATARNMYGAAGQIQDNDFNTLSSVSGTNTITGSLTPAITAYSAGMHVTFTPANNNSGAVTIAINGLTALDVVKEDGDALASGDLVAGVPAHLICDGDDFYLQNPKVISAISTSGNATIGGNETVAGTLAVAGSTTLATLNTLGSVSGTNTITGSLSPALASYISGIPIVFTPANNNTGAATLNVNSLGALDILKGDGDALEANDLVAGVPASLVLDSGADDWYLLNPQSSTTAIKSATTSRSSAASPTSDPHLSIALAAGTWAVDGYFTAWATASGAGGLQWQFAFSGTSTSAVFSSDGVINGRLNAVSKALSSALGAAEISVGTGITQAEWVRFCGVITVSVAGNLALQWSQLSSNANAANLGIGSWMTARRLA